MVSVMIPNQCLQLSEGMNKMRDQEILCDLKLETTQGYVAAHSVLLASCSPALCARIGGLQTSAGTRTLCLQQYPLCVIRSFVNYLYTGVLKMRNFDLVSLKTIFQEFGMLEIVFIIEDFEKGVFSERHDECSELKDMPKSFEGFSIGLKNAIYVNGTLWPLGLQSGCHRKICVEKELIISAEGQNSNSVPTVHIENRTELKQCYRNKADVCNETYDTLPARNADEHRYGSGEETSTSILDEVASNDDVCEIEDPWQEVPRKNMQYVAGTNSGVIETVESDHQQVCDGPPLGPPQSLVCPECLRTFRSECLKLTHMKTQHGLTVPEEVKDKLLTCKHPGCSYETLLQFRLQSHLKTHESLSQYDCSDCGVSLKSRSSLNRHKNAVHSTKEMSCDVCGKVLKNLDVLKLHKKRVHKATQLPCAQCPYTTVDPETLENHMHRKHGVPYAELKDFFQCQHCHYKTRRKNSFTNHMRRHTGDFPFQCEECGKQFPCRSDLTFHAKWHREKTHKCTYEDCQFAAVLPSKLQQHIRSQHTHKHVKPFICEVCGYQTNRRNNLILHIRNVHKLKVLTKHMRILPNKEQGGGNNEEDGIYVPGYEEAMEQYRKTTHTVSTINTNGLDEHRSVINDMEGTGLDNVSLVRNETYMQVRKTCVTVPPSGFLESSEEDPGKCDGKVLCFTNAPDAINSCTSQPMDSGTKVVIIQNANDMITNNSNPAINVNLSTQKSDESENQTYVIFQNQTQPPTATVNQSAPCQDPSDVPMFTCPPQVLYLNKQFPMESVTAAGSVENVTANLSSYVGQGQGQKVILNYGVTPGVSGVNSNASVNPEASLRQTTYSAMAPFVSQGHVLNADSGLSTQPRF